MFDSIILDLPKKILCIFGRINIGILIDLFLPIQIRLREPPHLMSLRANITQMTNANLILPNQALPIFQLKQLIINKAIPHQIHDWDLLLFYLLYQLKYLYGKGWEGLWVAGGLGLVAFLEGLDFALQLFAL